VVLLAGLYRAGMTDEMVGAVVYYRGVDSRYAHRFSDRAWLAGPALTKKDGAGIIRTVSLVQLRT
jgi:hypothetical protein